MEIAQAKIVIEAALLSSTHPLSVGELRKLFDLEISAAQIESILAALALDWQERGVRLVSLASGWRFQTAPAVSGFLNRLHPEKPPRYSRAVLETLAIVAYRQPVTRGDIEDIRGVTVSTQVVRTLEERGWIEVIGQKDVVGRPALFATTRQFLDDLGLRSLDELPELSGGRTSEPDVAQIGQQSLPLVGAEVHEPAEDAVPSIELLGPGADALTASAAGGDIGALPTVHTQLSGLLDAFQQSEAPEPAQPSGPVSVDADSPAPLKGMNFEH